MSEEVDHIMLQVVVTALLIRAGGQVTMPIEEWDAAIEHEGSLFLNRDGPTSPVVVALMRKVGYDA